MSAVLAAAESCTYDENMAEPSSYITVRLSHKGQGAMFRTVPEYDEEYRINDVTAYRFDEGTLQEILFPVSSEDGLYRFRVSETDGTLYVIANASEAAALARGQFHLYAGCAGRDGGLWAYDDRACVYVRQRADSGTRQERGASGYRIFRKRCLCDVCFCKGICRQRYGIA